jgi:hypothetical protein
MAALSQTGKPSQMRISQFRAPHSEMPSAGPTPLPTLTVANGKAQPRTQNWTHFVAGTAVVTGGALLIFGQRRAGLAIAAAGTALALLEEQDVIEKWWKNLPGYFQDAQQFLDKAEDYMREAAEQGHRLQDIMRR